MCKNKYEVDVSSDTQQFHGSGRVFFKHCILGYGLITTKPLQIIVRKKNKTAERCAWIWRLTKSKESVFWVHEHQHSPEQVFVHDVCLDVIGVVLHTKGQKLQDQRQQLSCLEVVYTNKASSCQDITNMQWNAHKIHPETADYTLQCYHWNYYVQLKWKSINHNNWHTSWLLMFDEMPDTHLDRLGWSSLIPLAALKGKRIISKCLSYCLKYFGS